MDDKARARGLKALALGASAVLFALFAWPMLRGAFFVEDDLAACYFPMRAFYQDCLRQGYSFLWLPNIFNGFYYHGEGEGGFLHPLHWVLYRFLPLPTAFMLEILSCYPLLFAGAYCFLRRWRVACTAALMGAACATFIGAPVNHYVHPNFSAALCHVFFQLYAIDLAMRGPRRQLPAAVALSLALSASQLLIGCPQYTFCAWLAELFYALFLLGRTRNLTPLYYLGGAKIAALLIGAAQLWPLYDMLQYSFRAQVDESFRTATSLHPYNLLQWVNPYLFQRRVYMPTRDEQPWDPPYVGMVTLLLALLAVTDWRALRRHRALAGFSVFFVLFGTLAALGSWGGIYTLFDYIPLVNKMRAPARYIALAQMGVCLLAALGWLRLLRKRALSGRQMAVLALVPLASGVITAAVAYARWRSVGGTDLDLWVMPTARVAFGAMLAVVGFALTLAAARGWRFALPLLMLWCFADIGLYSLRNKPAQTMAEYAATIDVPPVPSGAGRIDPDIHSFYMNRLIVPGYRQVFGYVSFLPARSLDYTQTIPLRLAGVEWRKARVCADPELRRQKLHGASWVPMAEPFPRARMLAEARESRDPMQDLAGIDPARVALTQAPLDLGGGEPGEAAIVRDEPGRIDVRVYCATRQLLVMAESYHDGWTAEDEDQPLPVMRVYGDFFGCVLEPGSHVVRFRFEPMSFLAGRWISIDGVAVSVLYILWLRRAEKKRGARTTSPRI